MNEEQLLEDKPSTNILAQIVHRYLPYWPIFVMLVTISMTISYVYLRSQTRIYIASAKVLLKDPQKNGGDSKVLDALNIFSEKKIVENEIIVLRSNSIMQQVVKELNLYTTIYNKGNVQTEELYGTGSPVVFESEQKDSINGGGKYNFDINWKNNTIEIAGQSIPFGGKLNINNTIYDVKINPLYPSFITGKNFYVVFNTVAGAAGSIIGSLKATPLSYNSTVIDLGIETPVPEKGVKILNKLFEIYNIAGIDDKNQIATKTLRFIDDRLNTVAGQLDSVEKNIETYKSRESASDLGAQSSLYFENVKEFDKRKGEVELQLEVLKDIESYVDKKGGKPGTVPSLLLVNDPTMATLLSQLYSAEFELDKVSICR